MIFDFSSAQISSLTLSKDRSLELLSALNLRHENGIFKITAPLAFDRITVEIAWMSDGTNGATSLANIYMDSVYFDKKYENNILTPGGGEFEMPWEIPSGMTWCSLTVNIYSTYMDFASGYLVLNDVSEWVASDNTADTGGDVAQPEVGEDNEGGDGGSIPGGDGGETPGEGGEGGEPDDEEGENGESSEGGGNGSINIPGTSVNFIYPVGTIGIDELPVALVGFRGLQSAEGYSHVRIVVAEILDNGSVGGEGHVWQSPFYQKDIDYTATLENLIPMCEGQEFTRFNVSFVFVQESETGYDYVDAYIVGGDTLTTTFTVQDVEVPLISVDFDAENKVYCLDPVLLTVNRRTTPGMQFVRVEIGNYIADFEFFADRNILEIDIAEYLETLFARVDLFEFQTLETTAVIKFYDADKSLVSTHSVHMECIYGKRPEAEIPTNLRLQWLDKFGHLHDVIFKVFDNLVEGESAQKYVVNREEREDKTGERSISLAYVGANGSQRIALETIVFSDHVRAYFDGNWKRVKVANTYKNGTGRVTKNFEITIKYAI